MNHVTTGGSSVIECGAYVAHVATALSAERLAPYLRAMKWQPR